MSDLLHTLSVGSQSLYATRQGVDTTAHNIANAQTEGYSRQRVNLAQRTPIFRMGNIIGNGVYVEGIRRSQDKFIEQQLSSASSSLGSSKNRYDSLLNLENIFSPELSTNVSKELDAFFDTLQDLSSYPEEVSVRVAVREQAKNLVASFKDVDRQLRDARGNFNEKIKSSAVEANDIIENIGNLNAQIKGSEVSNSAVSNDLRDQRDLLIRKLSDFFNINYYDDQFGMVTVRGPGDSLLVEGVNSARINVQGDQDNEGMYRVQVTNFEGNNPRDVTNHVASGKMHGFLEVRDLVAKTLIDENNEMAHTFSENFNSVHRGGFGVGDFSQANGRNFFKQVSDKNFAAQQLELDDTILNAPSSISTGSSPNSPGDNINVNNLLSLKSEKLLENGQANFTEYFSNYVGKLGIEAKRAQHMLDADEVVHSNLHSRREAVSGVSLDEEAANMIKWQTAFVASSKVITTIDEMLDTVIGLKR